jgi:hypothetical protein
MYKKRRLAYVAAHGQQLRRSAGDIIKLPLKNNNSARSSYGLAVWPATAPIDRPNGPEASDIFKVYPLIKVPFFCVHRIHLPVHK